MSLDVGLQAIQDLLTSYLRKFLTSGDLFDVLVMHILTKNELNFSTYYVFRDKEIHFHRPAFIKRTGRATKSRLSYTNNNRWFPINQGEEQTDRGKLKIQYKSVSLMCHYSRERISMRSFHNNTTTITTRTESFVPFSSCHLQARNVCISSGRPVFGTCTRCTPFSTQSSSLS